MNDLVKMSAREYAEKAHPGWGEFKPVGRPFTLFLHPGQRLVVQCERHSELGFGLDRAEAIDESYEEHGKTSFERDSEEFTNDFIEHFCNHLSLRQLNELIPAMIALRDTMITTRGIVLANRFKPAK